MPTIIGCAHETQLCRSTQHDCWYLPPSLAKDSFPDTATISVTKSTMAQKLLSTVLSASVVFPYARNNQLNATENCRNNQCTFPPEQWKAEARTWFEKSLASIQVSFLDVFRDRSPPASLEVWQEIPPDHQEMCKMGKFRSKGWRNVSVWGFLGIHFSVMAIFVASTKTEDETLWLAVGAQHIYQASCWLLGTINRVFWRAVR